MLKIYGSDLSAPSNKVRMTANALGLKYEYIRISIRDKQNLTEEYLRLHPAGRVPAIDDNGFILFESNAIIKYLASEQRSDLYPEDLTQRALVDQWIDFCSMDLGQAMHKVVFNRIFASSARIPVDERAISDGLKALNRFLPVVDRQLVKKGYLAGKEFSLADIVLLAIIDPAEVTEVELASYKNILQWREELRQKDFYLRCHKSYDEAFRKMMRGKTS